jgi:hypothetical protein
MSPNNPNVKPKDQAPFPVLEEKSLAVVPRRFMRLARRDLSVLPDVRPGSVLVFQYGSQYHAFTEAKPLTGAEEAVVDATSVFLVDVRRRQFEVQFTIPSARAADDFTIRATFLAQVKNAEKAAAGGPLMLSSYLTDYLKRDKTLLQLGRNYRVEDPIVRDLAASRIEAYWESNPIELPGISVKLNGVTVMINPGVRIHDHKLLSEERQQELNQLHAVGEDHSAARIRGHVSQGSGALIALGVARGETGLPEAIAAATEKEARMEDKLGDLIHVLQQNGTLDHVDIDPTDMLNAYVEKVTGKPLADADVRSLEAAKHSRYRHPLTSSGEDRHDEPVSDADLDNI